jgi:hypothetical protein
MVVKWPVAGKVVWTILLCGGRHTAVAAECTRATEAAVGSRGGDSTDMLLLPASVAGRDEGPMPAQSHGSDGGDDGEDVLLPSELWEFILSMLQGMDFASIGGPAHLGKLDRRFASTLWMTGDEVCSESERMGRTPGSLEGWSCKSTPTRLILSSI